MRFAISFLLSFALLLGGCPAIQRAGNLPSVSDVSSAFDVPGVTAGTVRVRLVNRLPEPVRAFVSVEVLGTQVHIAERTVPAGSSASIVGPGAGDLVRVRSELHETGRVRPLREQSYALNEDFRDGDVIVFVLADQIPPILICPGDAEVVCGGSIDPSATRFALALSELDDNPVITYEDTPIDDACPQVIERAWTATDRFGLANSCSQTIRIIDETPPAIICPPDAWITSRDDASPEALGVAVAHDVCDGDVSAMHIDVIDETDGATTIRRIWTARDACGNVNECVQTIRIDDEAPPPPAPLILCPDDVVLPCDALTDPVGVEPISCEGVSDPIAVLDVAEPGPVFAQPVFGGSAGSRRPPTTSDATDFPITISLSADDHRLMQGQGAVLTWSNHQPIPFMLHYNAQSGRLEFYLADRVASRLVAPAGVTDIFITVIASAQCMVRVDTVALDSTALDAILIASDATGHERRLRVACSSPSEGFRLSGMVTMAFPSPASTIPENSLIGFKVSAAKILYDSRGAGVPELAPGGDPATVLTYTDVLIGEPCGGRIERRWKATDSLGRTDSCVQNIYILPGN